MFISYYASRLDVLLLCQFSGKIAVNAYECQEEGTKLNSLL